MTPPITGRCQCGAVRYLVDDAPLWQAHCHCESCRRATASPFTSFFGVADGHWRWSGAAPAAYASSLGVLRHFCPTCGTPMAYQSTAFPDQMHFYAATLDDPESYQPTEHVHTGEQLSWVHLADDLPRT